jgi:PAS domain S-box-containing protein
MQSILASIGEGIILYDRDLRYRAWNPAMERLTGLPARAVLGRPALEVFPYLRQYGIDGVLARALAGEAVQASDIPYAVPETGRQGWQAGTFRPHYDAEGRIVGVVGVIRDITERKRAEEEMRRATAEWEQTFDTVPDAVAVLDQHHRIVRVNRAMANRLGIPPAACAGRMCFEVVHGLPEAPPWCPHTATCRDRREYTAELHEPRLGGCFLVTTTPRFDAQGALVGAIHVARDITEHKRAEAELRQRQADLNRAQAVARTGSWRIDVPGKTLVWSDETYRLFGVPKGTPLSYETFLAALHPDDRDFVDRSWQNALRGAPYDIEHRILVGGAVKWVRERAELECDSQGRLLGGFGTVQDVTDQKAAEAERRSLALFPEQNPSPVLRIARDCTLLYANPASAPLLAAWRCEVGGRLDGQSPLLEPLRTGVTIEHEGVVVGGRVYSLVCVPFADEGYVNVYGRDVTEKQHAEAAIRRQAALLDLSPDAIISRNFEGTIRSWSKGAEALYGWPAAEAIGRTTDELLQTQLPEPREGVLAHLQESGRWAGDLVHRTRDGRRLIVQSRWLAQRDAGGRIAEILESNVDITERHRAEEALAASRRLLHSILEQAPDGITVRDGQGCVMFVNGVARRRALRRPEGTSLAMAPEVWGEYLDADGKPVPVDEWPAARALRGETATREFLRRTGTRSLFVLNSAGPLRNDQGEIIGAVTVTTDITDRKRMEDQLRGALAQEERALADNRLLLREVHHRTKNNLQMLCDMLYLEAEQLEDGAGRQALEKSTGRVYAFARLHEQLHGALQGGGIEFGTYIKGIVAGFQQLYPHLAIRLDVPADPIAFNVDRALHAGLILNELVTNAAKHAFAGQSGQITVRVGGAGDQLELQVRDNGRGLPPDFNLAQARSLGLRIVHILARRLEAAVHVSTSKGTTFTLRFPRRAETAVEPRLE